MGREFYSEKRAILSPRKRNRDEGFSGLEIHGRIYLAVNEQGDEMYSFPSYEEAVSFSLNAHFKKQNFHIKEIPFFKNGKQALGLSKTIAV